MQSLLAAPKKGAGVSNILMLYCFEGLQPSRHTGVQDAASLSIIGIVFGRSLHPVWESFTRGCLLCACPQAAAAGPWPSGEALFGQVCTGDQCRRTISQFEPSLCLVERKAFDLLT